MDSERTKNVKLASWIAISGNTVLAVLKIVIGFVSGSLAVVGDGIDTSTDIITSFITLFAAMIMAKPPDKTHPYGHHRVEAVATKVVAFVIFFVGAQLALSTVTSLIEGAQKEIPSIMAIFVTVLSVVGKSVLTLSQFRLGRRYESPMIIANGRNMLNDIFISSGVLIGLIFTVTLHIPILDTILALAVSIWVMKTAVQVFMESTVEVMDGISDHSVYDKIYQAVSEVDGASNPHRTRIRQIANLYVIDLDIEVDGNMSVENGHNIAVAVEERIRFAIKNVYDIIVHVEPHGNVETDEKYGGSEAG